MVTNDDLIIKIDEKDIGDANFFACKFTNNEIKNRAFVNSLGAKLAIKYFEQSGLNVENIYNLHYVRKILEEFDIADVMFPNIHIDVRVVYDENQIFIPKSHFEYNIIPDIYLVMKVSSDFSQAELLGFFEPQMINKNNQNDDYYFIEKEKLSNIADLINYISEFKGDTEQPMSESDMDKIKNIMFDELDNDIDKGYKKLLLENLLKSRELRDDFIELENFETLSYSALNNPNIKIPDLNSNTLDLSTLSLNEDGTFDSTLEDGEPITISEQEQPEQQEDTLDFVENSDEEVTPSADNTSNSIGKTIINAATGAVVATGIAGGAAAIAGEVSSVANAGMAASTVAEAALNEADTVLNSMNEFLTDDSTTQNNSEPVNNNQNAETIAKDNTLPDIVEDYQSTDAETLNLETYQNDADNLNFSEDSSQNTDVGLNIEELDLGNAQNGEALNIEEPQEINLETLNSDENEIGNVVDKNQSTDPESLNIETFQNDDDNLNFSEDSSQNTDVGLNIEELDLGKAQNGEALNIEEPQEINVETLNVEDSNSGTGTLTEPNLNIGTEDDIENSQNAQDLNKNVTPAQPDEFDELKELGFEISEDKGTSQSLEINDKIQDNENNLPLNEGQDQDIPADQLAENIDLSDDIKFDNNGSNAEDNTDYAETFNFSDDVEENATNTIDNQPEDNIDYAETFNFSDGTDTPDISKTEDSNNTQEDIPAETLSLEDFNFDDGSDSTEVNKNEEDVAETLSIDDFNFSDDTDTSDISKIEDANNTQEDTPAETLSLEDFNFEDDSQNPVSQIDASSNNNNEVETLSFDDSESSNSNVKSNEDNSSNVNVNETENSLFFEDPQEDNNEEKSGFGNNLLNSLEEDNEVGIESATEPQETDITAKVAENTNNSGDDVLDEIDELLNSTEEEATEQNEIQDENPLDETSKDEVPKDEDYVMQLQETPSEQVQDDNNVQSDANDISIAEEKDNDESKDEEPQNIINDTQPEECGTTPTIATASAVTAETSESIEMLFDEGLSDGAVAPQQFVDNEVGNIEAKAPGLALHSDSSKFVNKTTIITVASLLSVLVLAGIGYGIKSKTNAEKNATANSQVPAPIENVKTEQTSQSNTIATNIPDVGAVNKPLQPKTINNTHVPVVTRPKTVVSHSSSQYMSVKNIVWQVPDYLSYSDKVRAYLKSAGKSIKLSLSSDLLLATDYAYSNHVKINLKISNTGTVETAVIVASSGSTQIDNIVLQSVKNTLNVVKPPIQVIKTPDFNLTITIYL